MRKQHEAPAASATPGAENGSLVVGFAPKALRILTPWKGVESEDLARWDFRALLNLPFIRTKPQTLVRTLKELPPTPKVLHRLQGLISNPNSDLGSIAEVVALEPGLAARVVRIANSTKFGNGSQSKSIMEAMQRVGLRGVHELVTFAVASQIVGRPLNSYKIDANSLWLRSVACALAAASLAQRIGMDPSEAYTAGLMHGVGMLVIDRYVTEQKQLRTFRSEGYPLDYSKDEQQFLGFSHPETGAALLEYWDFSEGVIQAVAHQLSPEKSPSAHRKLCMIIATARWARSLLCIPEEKIPELPSEPWLRECCIEPSQFGPWLADVRQGFDLAKLELRLG